MYTPTYSEEKAKKTMQFLVDNYEDLIKHAEARGDTVIAESYRNHQQNIKNQYGL